MSMLPPGSNIGRVRTSAPKMSTCTCNKAKREEKGLLNGDGASMNQEPNVDENELASPPSKPKNPSQKSSSRRRRHQRGGKKKKSVTEPDDGLQPLQAIDHTSPSTADSETHTARTNGVQHESPHSRSTTAHSDYSDIASVDSQSPTAPRRRRYQRGGRWKAKDSRHLQSVSELSIARDQTEYDAAPPEPEWRDGNNDDDEGDDYNAAELRKARSSRRSGSKGNKRRETGDTKSDTGIRTFNLRRADESGGRPIGLSAGGSGTGSESDNTAKEPKGRPTKEKKKGKAKKREEGNDKSEQEEKDKRKPVSIRLDLDLELEIFLRAKIKGDITITFL